MKNRYLLNILFLAIPFLFSCKQQKEEKLLPELVRAEALMYEHPDSALHILEIMDIPDPSDKLQNATWCVLMTQARDKNYLERTSDSLINIAYAYFMKQDDPQRRALVLNYEGVINESAFNDVEKATQFYLMANEEIAKTKDYQLGFLINNSLGNIYAYRHMPEYAMQAFQKAYQYATRAKNKSYIASSLSYIARAYSLQSSWDKAIEYYRKAYESLAGSKDKRTASGILCEMASIYNRIDKYDTAMRYAKQALSIEKAAKLNYYTSSLTIGDIYRNMGNSDSADYYFKQATLSDQIYTRQSAYQGLWYLHSDLTEDYKKALDYSYKFWLETDSIQQMDKSKELIQAKEKFDQQKLIAEKKQLKMEKERITNYYLLGLISLLCIVILLVYTYQHKLIKKERTIRKNKELINGYTIKVIENDAIIDRNATLIQELSSKIKEDEEVIGDFEEERQSLKALQQQNEKLAQDNLSLQEKIEKFAPALSRKELYPDTKPDTLEEFIVLKDRERFLCQQLIMKTEVLKNLKKNPKFLTNAQLEELCNATDAIFNNFSKRLGKQFPSLPESDLQLCCLLKLEVSISDIAVLLGISATSVSRKKLRLKRRIIQEQQHPFEESQTLDLWIRDF